PEGGDRLRLLVQNRRERVHDRRARERSLAGRHLVEDRPERELVRAEVERRPARLLRRHVTDRAEDDAACSLRTGNREPLRWARLRFARGLGQAEVGELDAAVAADAE